MKGSGSKGERVKNEINFVVVALSPKAVSTCNPDKNKKADNFMARSRTEVMEPVGEAQFFLEVLDLEP